jgi:hypothetical protein
VFTTPTGSTIQGQAVSAQATFHVDGSGNLVITLQNTASTTNAMGQVLSNIEFNMTGATFTVGSGSSVVIGSTSSMWEHNVLSGTIVAGTDIGGNWLFGTNTLAAGMSSPTQFGVSATSFVSSSTSAQVNLMNEDSPIDGADWGLAAKGSTANDGLKTHDIITDTVVITLHGSGVNLNNLSGVVFTYGSEQDGLFGAFPGGGGENPTPEPASAVLVGLGMLGMGALGVYRRKRVA